MRKSIFIAIVVNLLILGTAWPQTAPPDPARPEAAQPGNELQTSRGQLLQVQIKKAMDRVDGASIVAAIRKLQEQQEQLLLEAAGATGRRRGLESAIDKYTEMAQVRADQDPVVAELDKVVAFREQEMKRMEQLQKVGAVSASDVNASETALANSRAELAAAKQRAAGGKSSSEALDGWNREAMNLSIDATERQARLGYIEDRLQKLNKVNEDLVDLIDASNDMASGQFPGAQIGHKITPEDVNELISRMKTDYANLASTSNQHTTQPSNP